MYAGPKADIAWSMLSRRSDQHAWQSLMSARVRVEIGSNMERHTPHFSCMAVVTKHFWVTDAVPLSLKTWGILTLAIQG